MCSVVCLFVLFVVVVLFCVSSPPRPAGDYLCSVLEQSDLQTVQSSFVRKETISN